jgi:hypothetical protein
VGCSEGGDEDVREGEKRGGTIILLGGDEVEREGEEEDEDLVG